MQSLSRLSDTPYHQDGAKQREKSNFFLAQLVVYGVYCAYLFVVNSHLLISI